MTQNDKAIQQAGRDAQFADDEINLFDLIKDIKQHFHWLFGCTVVFTLIALTYALNATPVFKVEAKIKQSQSRFISELNSPELLGVFSLGVEQAFSEAKGALYSQEYRRDFYYANVERLKAKLFYNDQMTVNQNFQGFNNSLKVSPSDAKKDDERFLSISLELSDAQLVTSLLNEYVDYSIDRRLKDIEQAIESNKAISLEKFKYQISALEDDYFNDKTRRKLNLNEAQQIAKAVGQIDPVYSKSDILGSFTPPLYMYGLNALNAEEKALESREQMAKNLPSGEQHFIAGVPAILYAIKKLDDINVDYSKVKLAIVDEPAFEPSRPIKPKKALIVILGTLAGGFIGLMVALILAAFKRYKIEQ